MSAVTTQGTDRREASTSISKDRPHQNDDLKLKVLAKKLALLDIPVPGNFNKS